jgi:hypothetical protein
VQLLRDFARLLVPHSFPAQMVNACTNDRNGTLLVSLRKRRFLP